MATAIAAVLALLPAWRAVRLVRASSLTQYNDYWPMLDSLLGPDGGLRLGGLLEFRNEHPIFLPKTAYLLNVELFSGSNHALGGLVIVTVLAQVLLIGILARRTEGLGRWAKAAVVVTASSLLFARHGAWSFVKAMSGTAWLTTNLWVIAALVAHQRGRRLLVPVLALAATFSYGTGLAVWPALVVATLVRDRREATRQWPTFVAGTASLVWYGLWYLSRPADGPPVPRPSLLITLRRTLEAMGSVLADGHAAELLGATALVLILTAGVILVRTRPTAAAAWLGLASFGVGASALIALGRYRPLFLDLGASRYSSLSALTWVAAVGLVLTALPTRWWTALLPVPLILTATLGGSQAVEDLERSTESHDLLAIALRTDLADGQQVQGGLQPFPVLTDRLERLGHYPFTADFPFACGALGTVVPVAEALPDGATGAVHGERPKQRSAGGTSLIGDLDPGDRSVECVVVVDDADRVVGAAVVLKAEDADVIDFETLAPAGQGDRVVARLSDSDVFVPVGAAR